MEKALILTAPSGSGKTTLARMLLKEFAHFTFSISATTRTPRPNEVHGVHYYFLTKNDFEQKVKERAFLEWEEVYKGCFYGSLKSELQRAKAIQKILLFDIDVKGALRIKKRMGKQALSVFIKTPSVEILTKRLQKRGTETAASLQKRIARYEEEISFETEFDTVVVNDKLNKAYQALKIIVTNFFGI